MFRAVTMKARPMRVDFYRNPWDRTVKRLVDAGLSPKFIHQQVPELTMPQVSYRSVKAGGVRAYRNGETNCAKAVLRRVDAMLKECRKLRRLAAPRHR